MSHKACMKQNARGLNLKYQGGLPFYWLFFRPNRHWVRFPSSILSFTVVSVLWQNKILILPFQKCRGYTQDLLNYWATQNVFTRQFNGADKSIIRLWSRKRLMWSEVCSRDLRERLEDMSWHRVELKRECSAGHTEENEAQRCPPSSC